MGSHYLVVGLGKTGRGVSRFLLERGEQVIAVDDQLKWEDLPPLFQKSPNFQLLPSDWWDKLSPCWIKEGIVSPGFSPEHPLLRLAMQKGIPLISEIDFSSRYLRFPLIGVTGSNGKSTTVALISHICAQAGLPVFVGGNLGIPLVEALKEESLFQWGVVEVSSFQLELTCSTRFQLAGITNFFPNHLDRHHTLEQYFQTKLKIFDNQKGKDLSLVNFTSSWWSPKICQALRAQVVPLSISAVPSAGFWIKDNLVFESSKLEPLFSLDNWQLPGRHNLENLVFAVGVCRLIGISPSYIESALVTFRGLPHRLEKVGNFQGIDWYNDSKSTTPSATKIAVETLDRPMILILGGRAKLDDFSELHQLWNENRVKAVVIYGESRETIRDNLSPVFNCHLVADVPEAVSLARTLALAGDVVLFSPACTSWDQYSNFEERGDHFKRLVYEIYQ
ncbi:MAG: UDP-N-acetylmuramoylalanine--D-glutamate ligase [Candidatus Atribacteria bacterium]|nr:UDP-N-acetylmuramoylalanine--D-glutamate ligase [Candidatus Atribacteria bacterium]